MAFLKLCYYASGIYFLLFHLYWITDVKKLIAQRREYTDYMKDEEKRKVKFEDQPENVKNARIRFWAVGMPELIWHFLGLFTFNWIVYLFALFVNLIVLRVLGIVTKSKGIIYTASITSAKVLHIAIVIFVIINAYHLRIDLQALFLQLWK